MNIFVYIHIEKDQGFFILDGEELIIEKIIVINCEKPFLLKMLYIDQLKKYILIVEKSRLILESLIKNDNNNNKNSNIIQSLKTYILILIKLDFLLVVVLYNYIMII